MQTFLPYPDFTKSAKCLDWEFAHNRLSNQVEEGLLMLRSLLSYEKRSSHPVYTMWQGYERALMRYTLCCVEVLEQRTEKHIPENQRNEIGSLSLVMLERGKVFFMPPWIGDERLHSSHRSILLAKNPAWYSQFGWTEQPAVKNDKGKWPYFWPVQAKKVPVVSGQLTAVPCSCGREHCYIIAEYGRCMMCQSELTQSEEV